LAKKISLRSTRSPSNNVRPFEPEGTSVRINL
jgi:hypothetical protein